MTNPSAALDWISWLLAAITKFLFDTLWAQDAAIHAEEARTAPQLDALAKAADAARAEAEAREAAAKVAETGDSPPGTDAEGDALADKIRRQLE